MKINEFVWPEERIDHIAGHGVTPDEVEQVCFGRAACATGQIGG
jgi:uncharacterized protein